MSFCAACGLELAGDSALCAHHHGTDSDNWAEANRVMCDFFHRAKVPVRLTRAEREDEFWAA